MTALDALLLLAGLIALTGGAELLVRGAARLASRAGISPLIIGLTVVAVGTSSPELAVSTGAALAGQADIALGNVVGSNVFNVLFILGLSALITPLVVQARLVRIDVPLMIVVSLAVWLLALDGRLGRVEGIALVVGLVVYTVFLIRQGRREPGPGGPETGGDPPAGGRPARWVVDLALVAGGLALLLLGAGWLVDSAVAVARSLGISELVIGLTVIAAGTSLPEVATSILAALRGERDIAVGNVVGSNVFNVMGVLGVSAAVAPGGIPVGAGVQSFDMPVMVAVALACLPIFFTGHLIARWEGGLFLAYYALYTAWLVLDATAHPVTEAYAAVLGLFVLPLTAITLLVLVARAWRRPG